MARYIDADALSDAVHKSKIDNPHIDEKVSRTHNHEHDQFLKMIANAPTADVAEVKQIEIIRDDLKWWLETNTEKGVVYIPKHVVENMIAKMDGERRDT